MTEVMEKESSHIIDKKANRILLITINNSEYMMVLSVGASILRPLADD
ncbi:MAG: hypothetical protein KAZ87_06795 [Spirochaetes bacterium]|nr:hypothetical protein [Spirochaetota bacterium]